MKIITNYLLFWSTKVYVWHDNSLSLDYLLVHFNPADTCKICLYIIIPLKVMSRMQANGLCKKAFR
jgi:hypothetical protein